MLRLVEKPQAGAQQGLLFVGPGEVLLVEEEEGIWSLQARDEEGRLQTRPARLSSPELLPQLRRLCHE